MLSQRGSNAPTEVAAFFFGAPKETFIVLTGPPIRIELGFLFAMPGG
jgi:hypothetical protein